MSFFSPEYPLSNTINIKGQSTQRSKSRVEAMLERALIQPQQCSVDPLYNAQTWGIPIWAIDKLQAWLDKTCTVAAKDSDNLKRLRQSNQQSSIKDLRVRHLRSPHLKFESFQRNCRPVFVELPVWPTLNFFGEPGSCPFNTKRREKPENLRKDIKENREAAQTIKQEEDKEMTRRPRTAARTRRTEQLASGYCEICRISYRDLAKHVQSDQHLSFVRNDDNFLSLDTLINAGANVEAFLKLNRGKDIEKSCSLFPNEDSNIQDTVLPNVKVNRNAKSLSDFEGEDIKMVQCNGARRNLNLKLNSSHNLRTRAKHESGHLLRSKGSPWHEAVKAEKLYDKFPGFTIKKRAKGTIWIEEDDPQDKFAGEQDIKGSRESEYKIKSFSAVLEEKHCNDKTYDAVCDKCNDSNNQDVHRTIACSNRENSIQNNAEPFPEDRSPGKCKNLEHINGNIKNGCNRNPLSTNVNIVEADKVSKVELSEESKSKVSTEVSRVKKSLEECIVSAGVGAVCNGHTVVEEQKDGKAWDNAGRNEPGKDDKLKCFKSSRRGSRSVRGRHRLSVEERLIEDNRAYYKVEVLGSKLRSSVLLNGNSQCTVHKPETDEEKKDVPSSEKPVVVRFKRVRKSELSLLSDEAESFMFGDLRRDDSSEASDGEQSSVLPKETESEPNDNTYPSSFLNSSLSIKSEGTEDESQDSLHMGRARKRRRTHTEALIKDNEDYYKFETPGSRLRFQAPLTGVKEEFPAIEHEKPEEPLAEVERVYPSKPSAEVEKMQFSFEAVPKSEPWYQTYQRQDEGAEFWHYFSDGDTQKPFLLPYEIENFHEILLKNQSRSESKRKGRGRSLGCIGRSPRKSPRCHASTLAIMSTIIRKREQQQSSNTYTIEECQSVRSQTSTPDQKSDPKSDVDEELKEMVRNIDEMLNNPNDSLEMVDSFEADVVQTEIVACEPNLPKGPPTNLLELLDSCHEVTSCLENSSCASSECGEGNVESPLKRRKKRKNRTGWPGIKTKKRLQSKVSIDMDCARENVLDKETGERNNLKDCKVRDMTNTIGIATVENGIRINTCVTISAEDEHLLGFSKWKEEGCLYQTCSTSHKRYEEKEDPKVCTDVHTNSLSRKNLESCTDTSCNETDGNLMINQEFTFGKPSTDIVEVSENDPGNDENHENIFRKDMNPMTERRFTSKSSPNKRRQQRENNSSETHVNTSRIEQIENELFCRKKDSAAGIVVPRKHHNDNGLTRKRQRTCHSEDPDTEIERRHRHHHHHHSYHHHSNVCKKSRVASRKRLYSRKRTRKGNMVVSSGTTTMYDDENCKKDSYLSITCRKGDNLKSGMKNSGGEAPPVSSNGQRSEVVDCSLTGHGVAPTTIMAATKLEQRRSSIEFQPVVRMMKIDDKVEMDHSILSVTIASNRRLRSSSSPRSNTQPPKKRLKTGRGQFGRWLKSS